MSRAMSKTSPTSASNRNIDGDPKFTREPYNIGTTDIVSGFAEAKLTSEYVDAIARYGVTALRESNPILDGIPIAPHNLYGAIVGRPDRDLSLFVRATANSPRHVVEQAPGGSKKAELPWNVRLNLGGTLSNILNGFDIDLNIDNPFGFVRHVPYEPGGDVTFVEERSGTEVFVTVRWSN